eukprot:TRINITY_DN66723_c0_g1_i1.p1 TRINITY_DN66723_c0_g1~~TRINITY_DN66723_c0_g1_i1.p1  ORF type:complete len:282 (-),score=70.87 TRINITY_DN66723_c0_g1_i1:264-1109(-)
MGKMALWKLLLFAILLDMPAAAKLSKPSKLTAVQKLQVQVHNPKHCDEPEKVLEGRYVQMQVSFKIHASSPTGEPGAKIFADEEHTAETYHIGNEIHMVSGLDEGVRGLCKGDSATLVIPPDLGFGEEGDGAEVPGGAILQADVQILQIFEEATEEYRRRSASEVRHLFDALDRDGDDRLSSDEAIGEERLWVLDRNHDGFITRQEVLALDGFIAGRDSHHSGEATDDVITGQAAPPHSDVATDAIITDQTVPQHSDEATDKMISDQTVHRHSAGANDDEI